MRISTFRVVIATNCHHQHVADEPLSSNVRIIKTKAEPISVNWLNTPSKPEDSTGFEDSTGDTKLVLIEVPVAAVGRGVNSRLLVTQISLLPSPSLYFPSFPPSFCSHLQSLPLEDFYVMLRISSDGVNNSLQSLSKDLHSDIFDRAKTVIQKYHLQTCRLMNSYNLETFRHVDTLSFCGIQMETRSMRWEYKLDEQIAYIHGEKAEAANIQWQVILTDICQKDSHEMAVNEMDVNGMHANEM